MLHYSAGPEGLRRYAQQLKNPPIINVKPELKEVWEEELANHEKDD